MVMQLASTEKRKCATALDKKRGDLLDQEQLWVQREISDSDGSNSAL
jgi:hypothetical protein